MNSRPSRQPRGPTHARTNSRQRRNPRSPEPQSPPCGVLGSIGPLLMNLLQVKVSGAARLEKDVAIAILKRVLSPHRTGSRVAVPGRGTGHGAPGAR